MNHPVSPHSYIDDTRQEDQDAGKEEVASGDRGRSRTTRSTRQQNGPANLASPWRDFNLSTSATDIRLQPIPSTSTPLVGGSASYRPRGSPAATSSRTLAPPSQSTPTSTRSIAANTSKLSARAPSKARSTHFAEKQNDPEVVKLKPPPLPSNLLLNNDLLSSPERPLISTTSTKWQQQRSKPTTPRSSVDQTPPESKTHVEQQAESSQMDSDVLEHISIKQNTAINSMQNIVSVIVHGPREQADSDWILHCRRALDITNPAFDKKGIEVENRAQCDQYCRKIKGNNEYRIWKEEDQTRSWKMRIFWLFGKSATSNMTVALIDALKPEKLESDVLAYYFPCKREDPLRKPVSALQSLIYQLVKKDKSLFEYIREEWTALRESLFQHDQALYKLWQILEDMVDALKPNRVYLVIDSIHNWNSDWQKPFLTLMAEHCEKAANVRWSIVSEVFDERISKKLDPLRYNMSRSKEKRERRRVDMRDWNNQLVRPPEVEEGGIGQLGNEEEGDIYGRPQTDGRSSATLPQTPYLSPDPTVQQDGTETKIEKLASSLASDQRPKSSDSRTSQYRSIEKGAENSASEGDSDRRQPLMDTNIDFQDGNRVHGAKPVSERVSKEQTALKDQRPHQQEVIWINGAKCDPEQDSDQSPASGDGISGHRSRRKTDYGNSAPESGSTQPPASTSSARPGPDRQSSGQTTRRTQRSEKSASKVPPKDPCCCVIL